MLSEICHLYIHLHFRIYALLSKRVRNQQDIEYQEDKSTKTKQLEYREISSPTIDKTLENNSPNLEINEANSTHQESCYL